MIPSIEPPLDALRRRFLRQPDDTAVTNTVIAHLAPIFGVREREVFSMRHNEDSL